MTAIMSTNMSHQYNAPWFLSTTRLQYDVGFWGRTEFRDCCLQVWLAVVFPENKQNKRFPWAAGEAVTQQQALPEGSRGPSRRLVYLGSSSMITLDTEFHPVDASPLG